MLSAGGDEEIAIEVLSPERVGSKVESAPFTRFAGVSVAS
jgi:hypothetical protein